MSHPNPFNDRDAQPAESVFPMSNIRNLLQMKLQQGQLPDWTLGTANTIGNIVIDQEFDQDQVPLGSQESMAHFIACEMTKIIFQLTARQGERGVMHRAHELLAKQDKYRYPGIEELRDSLRYYVWVVGPRRLVELLPIEPASATKTLYGNYHLAGILDRANDPSHKKVKPVKVWHGEVQRLSPSPTYVWVDDTLDEGSDVLYCLCEDLFDWSYIIDQTTFRPLEDGRWRLTVPIYYTSYRVDGIRVA